MLSSSIEALRAGAWDYLPKTFSATHLQVLVGRASHAVMVTRETKALRQQRDHLVPLRGVPGDAVHEQDHGLLAGVGARPGAVLGGAVGVALPAKREFPLDHLDWHDTRLGKDRA